MEHNSVMNIAPGQSVARFPSSSLSRLIVSACIILSLAPLAYATKPATNDSQTVDHIQRIGSNFATLSARHWPDAAKLVGWCVFNMLLWGALLLAAGAVFSIALYVVLRRRGWFDAPWVWYRRWRWAWGVILIGCICLGAAGAGVCLGLQRQLHHAIVQQHMLDRMVGNIVIALYMDAADYRATGDETAEHVQKVIDDSNAMATLATADLHACFYELAEAKQTGWNKYLFRWLGHQYVSEKINELLDIDPRAALILFLTPNIEHYSRDHPDTQVGVVMFSRQLEHLRLFACRGVNALILPWLFTCLVLGLGAPLLLLIALRIAVRRTGRDKRRTPPETKRGRS